MNNSVISPHEHNVETRTQHIVTYSNPEDPSHLGVKFIVPSEHKLFMVGVLLGAYETIRMAASNEGLYKNIRQLYKFYYELLMESFEHKFDIPENILCSKEDLTKLHPNFIDVLYNITPDKE